MNILIVGASGATGRLLVDQLLEHGQFVKIIVRSPDSLPAAWQGHERLSVIQASLLDLSDAALAEHVQGCDAVASCLGHNLTFKGIFGHPRRLVTEATRRLCTAIKANKPAQPVKFVLMNTVGNRNRDRQEPISLAQQGVIGLLRLLVPPHADNEQAADYLRTELGQQDAEIAWAVVRPDSLLDEKAVTAYDLYPSPIRSAIFDPGKTSRINVAHLMAELITDDTTWRQWQGQMPVIYNRASSSQ
ncbi:MAG: NAD(P)-binding oxidoreductase [Caldilineaceae bacterium]